MIAEQINTLRSYLLALPVSLPIALETSPYNFKNFNPDSDWIEDAGEEAAINRELEITLGSRANGLAFPERGPGVVALADVLEKFIQNFPNSVIPTLWLTDVTKAAETMITAAGLQVCAIFQLVLISFAVVLTVDCSCRLPASRIWRLQAKMKGQSLRLARRRKRSPSPRVKIAKNERQRIWSQTMRTKHIPSLMKTRMTGRVV
jgi:hypothetical protein